jgi:hypothetical protein
LRQEKLQAPRQFEALFSKSVLKKHPADVGFGLQIASVQEIIAF